MRRSAAFMTVAGILVLSVGFAAPAQALDLPPGAPATLRDVRVNVPSSLLSVPAANATPDIASQVDAIFANENVFEEDATKRTPVKAPATPGMKLATGAASTLNVLFGVNIVSRLSVGGISAVSGFDANGAACRGTSGNQFVSVLMGFDCTDKAMYGPGTFVPNADQTITWATNDKLSWTLQASDSAAGDPWVGHQATLKPVKTVSGSPASPPYSFGCYTMTIDGQELNSWVSANGNRTFLSGGVRQNFSSGQSTGGGTNTLHAVNSQKSYYYMYASDYANNSCLAAGGDAMVVDGVQSTPQPSLTGFGHGTDSVQMQQQQANPGRTIECVVTMTDGTVVRASTPVFHETDKSFPAPACPAVPAGKVPDKVDYNKKTDDGTSTSIGSAPVDQRYKDWATKYPECADGSCVLELAPTPVGTNAPESCFDNSAACTNWFTDPSKTDHYQCTYGGHAVDLSECNVYANTFKPTALPRGQGLSDPKTGNPMPVGTPSTIPTDQTAYDAMPRPNEGPGSRQCFPSGYDQFNPVQWVMMPVQCAMEWAFVPTPATVQTQMKKANDSWANTPMAKIGPVLLAWGGMFPHLDGCQGPKVSFHFYDMGGDYYPLDACKAPLDTVATTSRVVGAVGMYFLAGLAITRYLGATFGYTGLGSGSKE